MTTLPSAPGQPDEAQTKRRTVVVCVGTDHHPFGRLMDWVEHWVASASAHVDVVVQHGPARCPAGTTGHEVLPHPAFLELLAGADVVVTQGGPSTIHEALAAGRRPLAVPRTQRLGEAVDDHQIAFCRRMEQTGYVHLADTLPTFTEALDAMLADRSLACAQMDDGEVAKAVALAGGLIDDLLARRRRGNRTLLGRRRRHP